MPPVQGSKARAINRRTVLLAGLGVTLLLAAWIVARPRFGAPDEASHYDRAVGITNGVILGPNVVYGPDPQLTPTQQAFINHDTTAVDVPARLMPPDVGCINGKPNVTSCLVSTPTGNFPPLGYLLPAVALNPSNNVTTGSCLL